MTARVVAGRYEVLDTLGEGGFAVTQATGDLRVSVPLPPNGPSDFYLLTLSGSRGTGKTVGSLITHGQGGMGWDYRFRVQ